MSAPNRRNREREVRVVQQRPGARADPPRGSLAQRLDDGYQRIEQAIQRGEDTTAWENFWIDLLGQYEDSFTVLPGEDAVPKDAGE